METFEAALARAEAAVHDDHFNAQAACEALLAVLQSIHTTVSNDDEAAEPEGAAEG